MHPSTNNKAFDLRLLFCVVGIFALSVMAGGLMAPLLYNLLVGLGRGASCCSVLRETEFEKVTSRCVLLAVLGGAFLMMRCAGMTTLEKQGFQRGVRWKSLLAGGFAAGILSMALLLVLAGVTGAYLPGAVGWGAKLWIKMAGNLIGAVLVGYMEEWLFRGVIFGTLRKAMGVLAAVLVSSVFFSLVHFARPENPVGVVFGHWDSAFRLMPYMFTYDDIRWGYEGYKMATLFFMGVTLCFFYAYFRNLYFIIGLHTGWVWIMRLGDAVFDDRNTAVLSHWFGPTPGVVKSGVALVMSILFALFAAVLYYRKSVNRNT